MSRLLRPCLAVLMLMLLVGSRDGLAAPPPLERGYPWEGVQTARLTVPAGEPSAMFGSAVAFDGERLATINQADDSILLYGRSQDASGSWTLTARIPAPPATDLVPPLVLQGDTLVVGAPDQVLIFERRNGRWQFRERLIAPWQDAYTLFGYSFALSGDTLAVGAPWRRVADLIDSGVVLLYQRNAQGWGPPVIVTPDEPRPQARFGIAVALDGDTLAIGASTVTYATDEAGAAYLFERDGSRTWRQQARLTASDAAPGDHFGKGLALDGDTLAVNRANGRPTVMFERSHAGAGTWDETAQLIIPEATYQSTPVIRGDLLAVGTVLRPLPWHPESTAVYVFGREPAASGGWAALTRVMAADGRQGDLFGNAFALGLRELFTGASHARRESSSDAGAIYVHRLAVRPTAADDLVVTDEERPVAIDVLANDSAPPGAAQLDRASVQLVTPPAHGEAAVDRARGTIVYTPTLDYNGLDPLIYRVGTTDGASQDADVRITVRPVNDPPVWSSASLPNATAFSPYRALVTAQDVDVGDRLTISALRMPAFLTLADGGDGSATLQGTPGDGDVGVQEIELLASDQGGASTQVRLVLTVNPNSPPLISSPPREFSMPDGTRFSHSVYAWDRDPNQPVTLRALELPGWMQIVASEQGWLMLEGVPGETDVGRQVVRLVASDPGGLETEQRFSFTVIPDTPAAPSPLTAAPAGPGSVQLRWGDRSTNERGFWVERRGAGEEWRRIAELPPDTTSYLDEGRPCGVPAEYRVFAYRITDRSPPSANRSTAPERLVTRSYPFLGSPVLIGGRGGAGVSVLVTDTGPVADMNAQVTISHPAVTQLQLWLVGPDGSRRMVAQPFGRPGPDYRGAIFDDEAERAFIDAAPPYTGALRPQELLWPLDGLQASGLWRLEVTNWGNFGGTITDFSLTLTVGDGCPDGPPRPTATPGVPIGATPTPTATPTNTPIPTRADGVPAITALRTDIAPSGRPIADGDVLDELPYRLVVLFNRWIMGYDGTMFVVEEGPVPGFQTVGCELQAGDTLVHSASETFNYQLNFISQVFFPPRPQEGRFRLVVCDTITGNYPLLDGDGDGQPGGDYVRTFTVRPPAGVATATPTSTATATATPTPTSTATASSARTSTTTPTGMATATATATPTATAVSGATRPRSEQRVFLPLVRVSR